MPAAKNVEEWMSQLSPDLREVADVLRDLIVAADPDLGESIKWGNPVYEKDSRVCSLSTNNDKGYISLGFFNATALSDPHGLMEGTGEKMRHVKVRGLQDVRPIQLSDLIRQAVALNDAP